METAQEAVVARRFIRTGKLAGLSESDMVKACDSLIQVESRKSITVGLRLAHSFVRVSRSYGAPMQLTAWRSYARLLHMNGQHKAAAPAYERARKLTDSDKMTRGRIDRALVDVYMYLGKLDKAQARARAAVRTFSCQDAQSDLAQTRVNIANVLHRQDRHREAEVLYHQSASYFDKVGNRIAAARCYYNQANTLVQLCDFDKAEKLYVQAREIYEADGFDLDACDAQYGLAWLNMLRGSLHIALLELTACESQYRKAGDPRGEALCSLDRAEVYLNLGLYGDARDAARQSEKMFSRLGLTYEKAKSALFRGQAAAALGEKREAMAAHGRASDGFAREKNAGFLGVVHLFGADLSASQRNWRRELAAAQVQFRKAQLPLWQAMCDLKQGLSDRHSDDALKRLRANPAVRRVPYLYALWQTAEGDLHCRMNRAGAAHRSWQRAANRLDVMRSQLPPIELRGSAADALASPHQRLVQSLLLKDPAGAAYWSERSKTAGLWAPLPDQPSARRNIVDSLAKLSSQVASLSRQISGTGERQLSSTVQSQYLRGLQRVIREQLAMAESSTIGKVENSEETLKETAKLSESMTVVQFHILGNDLNAFIHEHGSIRVRTLKNGVSRLASAIAAWRFIAEGELLAEPNRSNTAAVESALCEDLADWLWAPLEISVSSPDLLIIPEGQLYILPWPALRLANRTLGEQYRFVVAPSIRHYLRARRTSVQSDDVLVFRGVDDNLRGAASEIDFLEKRCVQATVFSPAHRSEWPESGSARVWHYAGHAQLREDNPFYSYLQLADGPLFATDFRLKNCSVHLVTLAACRSGEYVVHHGNEPVGLVRSLLEMGARNVIAGRWTVADQSSAEWMQIFYDKYFGGFPVSEAIQLTSLEMRERYRSAFHWAAFAAHGAGA